MRDAVENLLLALDQPFLGKVCKDLLSRLIPVHALIFFRNLRNDFHLCLCRHQIDQRQIVAAANLEVVEVMCRGDLHCTRPLFRIRVFVGDDRDRSVRQRQDAHAANHMLVALIIRMHGHSAVAKHGFGAGRRNRDIFVFRTFEPVFQVPHRAFLLALLDLKVRDSGQQFRVPVDQSLVTVDQPVAMHLDENLDNSARQTVIEGKAVAFPVRRGTQPAHLSLDGATRLCLPFPHALEEFFTAHIAPVDALLGQLTLYHHLRCDAGMVLTRLPQRVVTAHTVEPDQQILKRESQGMTHMQAAGHIWRRHHDYIGVGVGRRITGKIAAVFPAFVPVCFDDLRIVGLGEFFI